MVVIKKIYLIFILLIALNLVRADPPQQLNILGYGLYPNGTGLENGWVVHIIDEDSESYTTTQIFAPPIPQLRGIYSATILGSFGDFISVWIFNETHFGINNATVTSANTRINVTLNETRASEVNISILNPLNNTIFNINQSFNVSANLTIIGGQDGAFCDVDISISNSSVFSSDVNRISFANIGLIDSRLVIFNISILDSGYSNITINASCLSDGRNFNNLTSDSISNITAYDNQGPRIVLISPINGNLTISDNNISYVYVVNDNNSIANCSFIIDGQINATDNTISRGLFQNFTLSILNGYYNWSIGCFDIFGNYNQSVNRTINISVFYPTVISFDLTNPVMLVPASNQTVNCTFTVQDLNGASDIVAANASLRDYRYSPSSIENPNYFYKNDTCIVDSQTSHEKNFTCAFQLPYYANNGTWTCEVQSYDVHNHNVLDQENTTVLPLFSFDVFPFGINYGKIPANATTLSDRVVSITNTGNVNFSLYVWGYGGYDNNITGYNKSFICNGNNISVGFQKYSNTPNTNFDLKTNLTGDAQDTTYDVIKQTNNTNSTVDTYWQLFVPSLVPFIDLGTCNGTVVFEAFP